VLAHQPVRSSWPALRIATAAELISLAILLINLATVHWRPVASLFGPVHGCAYLLVIALTVGIGRATTGTKLTALVPGIGGLLVLRQLPRTAEPK